MTPALKVVLSAWERKLLRLLAGGRTNAQVAQAVHRSEKTVRNHLSTLYRKLGAANRTEAVALYITHYQPPKP